MQQPSEMTTLSQVLEKLRTRGIDNEIRMNDDKKMVSETFNKTYEPEDITIVKTFRFEGDSDPGDNAVVYITEDGEGNMGYILDAYGAYSNYEMEFDDFLKKIKMEDRDEQELFDDKH